MGAMTTAFVLSGGASLGSIQVGMLFALAEAGIAPEMIVGTSVGAVHGGWIASRPDLAGVTALADLWQSLSRSDVLPTRPVRVSPSDFSQSAQLTERSHAAARQWLSSRHPVSGEAALLEPHRH
jgi:predicted acylesterase/phospholipase RssA